MSDFKPERGSEEWYRQRAGVERGSEAWNQLHRTNSVDDRKWYAKKRFFIPAGVLALLVFRIGSTPPSDNASAAADWSPSVSSAGLDTADRSMDFEKCNRQIRVMADKLGTTPTNITDNSAMRVVRFPATDGSVVVTCDAIDEKMIVVQSPHSG